MNHVEENRLAIVLCAAGFIVFAILTIFAEGFFGGADNLSHYKFARYGFEYPEYFLNHWAKPVFTLLSSPFAQFGIKGIAMFNVLIGSLTAFIAYNTARHFNYKNAFLTIVLVLFAPVYSVLMPTALTEILFSFVLMISILLYLKKHHTWSAVVLSFLPFVRTEGVVIFAIFGLAWIIRRKCKALPFLLTGFLLYSIVGYFHFNDFFWVINRMPYTGAKDIYGQGSLFHFIINSKKVFGILLSVLLLAGFSVIIFRSIKAKDSKKYLTDELLVIVAPLLVYFAAHSFVWWQGLGGSLGLLRVMAGVVPLAAILGLKGLNFLLQPLRSRPRVKYAVLVIFCVFYIKHAFEVYKMPVPIGPTEKMVKRTSEWLKDTKYYHEKIYYYNPWFFYFLNLDPNDNSRTQEHIPDPQHPGKGIAKGDIVIWDAHFGPNEGRLPLQRIKNHEHFETLKVFKPKNSFTVLGGHKYEIHVFRKTETE